MKLNSYLCNLRYNVQQKFQSKIFHVFKCCHNFIAKRTFDVFTFGLDEPPERKHHKQHCDFSSSYVFTGSTLPFHYVLIKVILW